MKNEKSGTTGLPLNARSKIFQVVMNEKAERRNGHDFMLPRYWQHRPVALSYTLAGIEDLECFMDNLIGSVDGYTATQTLYTS